MTDHSIKDAVVRIPSLDGSKSPMLEFMRAWMIITGLDFEDVVLLSYEELVGGLARVSAKLVGSLDIFDEDQAQEAACRCLGKVVVAGPIIEDADVAVRTSQRIEWDGSTWNYTADPRMRVRGVSKSFTVAVAAVKEVLGR
jgi:hypothetical protein